MTSDELEELIRPHLQKCMAIVDKALIDAKMNKNDIHDVVLVGGSTKIPKVQEMLSEYFNGMQLKQSIKIDQAVAYGAAIQAAIKLGRNQGRGMRGKVSVRNVIPFSLGIQDVSGRLDVQVPKDSALPFTFKQTRVTVEDYQTCAGFKIFEGENRIANKNRLLGKFCLNVPSLKKEEAEMELTTVVDEEGIVKVKAVCLIDGAKNDIVIDTYKGRMTQTEIENRRVSLLNF